MPDHTEQEIINGCRKQQRLFQEHLYKTHYGMFLKVCARYAKDMEDAEQLVNDGFLKIFRNIDSYKESGSFEGWMRRIMVNTCLDYLKSSYLKNSMQMQFNGNLESKEIRSYDADALSNIELKELVKLIQGLPHMTRTVFNLYVFEEYTHRQIGELLGISEGTSFWHVSNGRKLLQKKIISTNVMNPFYEKRV